MTYRLAPCSSLSALAWLALCGAAPAAEGLSVAGVSTVKNIAYYDGPDQHKTKHRLDLYLPRGVKDFPVLFFVHGGAWVHGDKDFFGMYSLFAHNYARAGVGVVVTNYRLSPAVQHPEHVKDVARAFAWTYKNIAKHGGRADRLFISGHSAGGHLVSLLTTDATYLKDVGLSSKAIRGVIPISGVFQIPAGLFGRVFGAEKESQRLASPLTHVRGELPPFLILYADKDLPGCNKTPAQAFCKALKGKDVRAEAMEIAGSDHIRILLSAAQAKSTETEAILKFIRAHTEK